MDRNAKEIELFKDWAKSSKREERFSFQSNAESYFHERGQNEKYIWEYDFEMVPELRDLLEEQWKDDKDMEKILTAVLVAAIKNKPRIDEIEDISKQAEDGNTEELPMYIYNF